MEIWKWALELVETQVIRIPLGAKILTVQVHDDQPQMWALVYQSVVRPPRKFVTYGTGNPMPDGDPGNYIGTYQLRDGLLVFHVFESIGL